MHSNILRLITAITFFVAILGTALTSSAQINDEIRSSSSSSTSNNQSKETNSYDNSSNDDISVIGDCCSALISDVACSIGTWLFADLIDKNIENIDSKKEAVPRITSLDLELPIGVIPDNYIIVQPRLKLNGGWFGTDIRTHHGIERRLSGWDTYTTIGWQILKLNLLNTKKLTFGIGNGFVYEGFSKRANYEATTSIDIYPTEKWRIGGEFRYANDAANERVMRLEGNGNMAYTLYSTNHFEWHALARFMYARYYETVDIWAIQFGTSIRIQ